MNPEADRSLNTEPCHCGAGSIHYPDAHRRPTGYGPVIAAPERAARRRRGKAARKARRAQRSRA